MAKLDKRLPYLLLRRPDTKVQVARSAGFSPPKSRHSCSARSAGPFGSPRLAR